MAFQAAIPPGGTWFDTLKKSFVDVPVDSSNGNAIPTSDFLEAAESLTTLFGKLPALVVSPSSGATIGDVLTYSPDLLGSLAFTPVKNDMIGNIKVPVLPLPPSPLPPLSPLFKTSY